MLVLLAACTDQTLGKRSEPPEVSILSHTDGETVLEGEIQNFQAVAQDPESGDLVATWFAGSRTLCAEAAVVDTFSTCDAALTTDDSTVTVSVGDPDNNVASDAVSLTVAASGAPDATLLSPEPGGSYYSDRLISFSGTVNDAEDTPDLLGVSWSSSVLGALDVGSTVSSDGTVTGSGYLTAGEHYVTLDVTDTSGKSDQAGVVVQVGPPNSTPSCAITEPADGASGAEGASVTFRGTVADADIPADQLAVTWSSNWDGTIATGTPSTSGEVALTTSRLTVGTHTLTLTATDDLGETCTDFILYTVSTAPSLTLLSPVDGDRYTEGDAIVFEAEVFDYEDAATDLLLEWESNLDGLFSTAGADSTGHALFSLDDLSIGEHTLTVTVTDTSGLWVQDAVAFTVNGAPSAPDVSLSPDPAGTDDDLVVAIDTASVDPDGDPVTYDYAWYEDGVVSGASTSALLPAAATTRGETWRIVVTPNDGTLDGPSGEASLTIGNTAPEIATVSISPDPAGTGDDLTCSWSGYLDSDADTDRSTVAWTLDGATAGSGTKLSSPFDLGDVAVCTVTPFDGTDTGTPVSATLTITNSPPEVTSLTLTPASPDTDDTLTASASVSDAEGDPITVTYGWTVDGVAVAAAGTTLTGDWFEKHDVVEVTVTPEDGTSTGTPVSASVTIQNTAPGAPSISIDPADPDDVVDLVCTIDADAEDLDGDTMSYTISWTVDGVAFTGTTSTYESDDTVPGTATADGEVWACTVEPDDGDTTGPLATASVTIDAQTCGDSDLDGTYGSAWTKLATAPNNLFGLMTWQGDDTEYIWNAHGTNLSYYDPAADTWHTVSSSTPCTRTWNSMAPYDGDLWMIGCNNVYNYDIDTDTWTVMASYSGDDAYNQTVADCEGRIYGYEQRGNLVIYDVATDTVSYVATTLGSESETRVAYDPTDEAVFFGDFTLGYVHRYDTNTGAVTTMTSTNPEGFLNDIFCGDWNGHIYAAGGSSGTSIWQYDIAANSWSTITAFPVDHGNNGSCTVSADGWLYMADHVTTTFHKLKLY